KRHSEQEQELPPVAIADRAEVQHRRGEAERVSDRDQVERRLRGVEVLPDVGQRDVRDGEVEVRHARDDDQREQDEPGPLRSGRRLLVAARLHVRTLTPTGARGPHPGRMNLLREIRSGSTKGPPVQAGSPFVDASRSWPAKYSSAFFVLVSCSPARSTPACERYARASAATLNISDGAHFVDSSMSIVLSG